MRSPLSSRRAEGSVGGKEDQDHILSGVDEGRLDIIHAMPQRLRLMGKSKDQRQPPE